MNEISNEKLENLIYEIRGKQVMLDSDLANQYKVETKRINEAVSRNKEKFPDRFCFRITEEEYNFLKSHIATSKGGSRKGHTVFTEQGVAMLATILKSKTATEISIKIMDAFVAMRHFIGNNLIEQKYINNQVLKNTEDIKLLQESFNKFEEKKKINEIYFNGQIFDAYSRILDIFKETKDELIIIDSYAYNNLFDIIKKLNVKVILITTNKYITKELIEKYKKQYNNLRVIYNNSFHDRYFILDKEKVYHCGTSINRIGYKTFGINIINDEITCKSLLNKVNDIISS